MIRIWTLEVTRLLSYRCMKFLHTWLKYRTPHPLFYLPLRMYFEDYLLLTGVDWTLKKRWRITISFTDMRIKWYNITDKMKGDDYPIDPSLSVKDNVTGSIHQYKLSLEITIEVPRWYTEMLWQVKVTQSQHLWCIVHEQSILFKDLEIIAREEDLLKFVCIIKYFSSIHDCINIFFFIITLKEYYVMFSCIFLRYFLLGFEQWNEISIN